MHSSASRILASLFGAWLAVTASASSAASANYEVTSAATKASPGVKTAASLTLASKNGWHLNEEAPMTVKLSPGAGITVDKPKLSRADATEKTKDRARFDISFMAADPGQKKIDAEASFVICQETACKPVKQKLALAIEVSPAPPARKR
jgi:DsbC/DsbD-like thiol-disulfide interchange protein